MKLFDKYLPHCQLFLFFHCLAFLSPVIAKQYVIDSAMIHTRNSLIERFDSLNLEKQKNKRNGKPILELENKQFILRDSIKLLKEKIENSITVVDNTSENHFALLQPQSIFDWIILIVGVIAIISSIFMIIGIISMFTSKNKKRTPLNAPSQLSKKISSQQNQPSMQSIAALQALADKAANPVKPFQKKMHKDSEPTALNKPHTSNNKKHLSSIEESTKGATGDNSDHERNLKIFEAAQKGMSLHDISKKFHLSTDHVSLIIKVMSTSTKKS